MKRTPKNRKLHSDERILLLLSEYKGKRDLWDVPREVTQKGISQKLDILENNISRSLKRLAGEGLVGSELKHVKGEKRRQKAYFPTYEGEKVIEGLIERTKDTGIEVLLDGEEMKISVLSAYRRAKEKGLGLTLVEVYDHGERKKLPLDLDPGWKTPTEGRLIGNYQMPVHFYGREEEIDSIIDFQNSRSGVLVIRGLAGIGKTSLILKAVSDSEARAGYIRCETWTDRYELMNELGQLMVELDLEDIADDMTVGELTPGKLARSLKKASKNIRGLTLIIDDLQKTEGGIDVYMEGICRASMDSRWLKVVLLTREKPSFLDPRFEIQGLVRSMELKGLDPRSVGLMIKAEGRGGDVGAIWDMTKGHPLFIELYMSSEEGSSRVRFTGFLNQEVFSALSPSQRRALQMVAQAGHPVHRALLGSTSTEDLDLLKRKGLLREVKGGLLSIHDLLSDHVKGTVDPELKEEMMKELLSYRTAVVLRIWEDGPDPLFEKVLSEDLGAPAWMKKIIDRRHSSVSYEDEPELRRDFKGHLDSNISLMIDRGMKDLGLSLISLLSATAGRGRGRHLIAPITRLERSGLDEDQLFSVRLRRALIETREDDLRGASKTVRLIEATYPSGRIRGKEKAILQHIKGKISRSEKRYKVTISSHRSSLRTYEKIGDRMGAAKERIHLAKALHQGGMPEKALKEAIRSASDFNELRDPKKEVHSCLQAFRSALVLGRTETADTCLVRADKVSNAIADNLLITLVNLERMFYRPETVDTGSISRLDDTTRELDGRGLRMAVKGCLRICSDMTDSGQTDNRMLLLKKAASMLGRIEEEKGDPEDVFEVSLLMIDLREQTLEILTDLDPKREKKAAESFGLPFFDTGKKDPDEAVILDTVDRYRKVLKLHKKLSRDKGGSLKEIDDIYEGAVHTYLLAGITLKNAGKRTKARKMFSLCSRCIGDYERMISDEKDKAPSFDLRMAKKVLEENRSLLENS